MHNWEHLGFFGGHTALDFVNTMDDEDKSRSADAIPDWPTLLSWSSKAHLLSEEEMQLLHSDNDCNVELEHLRKLREELWLCLHHMVSDRAVPTTELQSLNTAIIWMLSTGYLEQKDRSFTWHTSHPDFGVTLVRARIVGTIMDLLMNADLTRLRECGRCTGMFLNSGRGKGRRWCRMTTCGNREKISKFRRK